MFRSLVRRSQYSTAVLSVLSGTTALLSWHDSSSSSSSSLTWATTRCEGAPENDDDVPPPSSQTLKPPKRIAERSGTRFFTQIWSSGVDNAEAASGIGGGRQQGSGGGEGEPTYERIGNQRPKSRPPCQEWDFNWDGRQTNATSPETMGTKRGFYASREIGNVRHILLIRHGQYREDFKDDTRRILTPLGRHQAELTGQRLAIMARGGLGMINPEFAGPCAIKAIHVSDMTRAKETAKIIASHLPGVPLMEPDPMLNEALPAGMIPSRPDIDQEAARREIEDNQDRIEAAFRKYIHRADAYEDQELAEHSHEEEFDDNPHEFEIIVGHGNVIRYFFCRALQLPPEVWLRFSTFNCSIAYIMIQPNGFVSIRGMGDFGHMGYDNLTFSGLHGLNW